MDIHTLLSILSLVAAISAMLYSVRTTRQTRHIMSELARQREIGMDAWVSEQIKRWSNGELASRTEPGVGVSGTDVEVIEPLPGWRIVVGTTAHGKRIPFDKTATNTITANGAGIHRTIP